MNSSRNVHTVTHATELVSMDNELLEEKYILRVKIIFQQKNANEN